MRKQIEIAFILLNGFIMFALVFFVAGVDNLLTGAPVLATANKLVGWMALGVASVAIWKATR